LEPVFLTTFLEVLGWITMAAIWILLIFMFVFVLIDIFRRPDISGLGKAGWIFVIFILPLIGVLIYLVARPAYATYNDDIGVLVSQMSEPATPGKVGIPRGS
jgi:hypothetical protein